MRSRAWFSLLRPRVAGLLATAAVIGGCGYTEIHDQCPSCIVVARDSLSPALPRGTRTVFVIVPGLLGFGWEWDQPMARLRAVPGAVVEAFDWRPSSSAARAGGDLARVVNALLADPRGPLRVVIIGHSAGGLVTAWAASEVRVPDGRGALVVNIGTPYAGMHTLPAEGPIDAWQSPVALAIGGDFTSYPPPAPGVRIESWVTPWPGDPVMMPRYGHHPDDPNVGPPGPRYPAPAGTDHNRFVARVVDDLAARVTAVSASP